VKDSMGGSLILCVKAADWLRGSLGDEEGEGSGGGGKEPDVSGGITGKDVVDDAFGDCTVELANASC
jgi:hypothetical protein